MKSFKTGAHRARGDDRLAIYRLMQAVAAYLHNHAELSDLPSGKCLLALSLCEERLSLSSLSLSLSIDKCAKLPLSMLLLINSTATPFPYVVLNFDAMLPTSCCLSLIISLCLYACVCVCFILCILVASCLRWLLSFQHRGICMIHCVYLWFWLPWFNVSIVRKVSSSPVILCKFPTCTRHEGPPDGGSMRIE